MLRWLAPLTCPCSDNYMPDAALRHRAVFPSPKNKNRDIGQYYATTRVR